jgi:Skp family chaperone for outer membrane proteins
MLQTHFGMIIVNKIPKNTFMKKFSLIAAMFLLTFVTGWAQKAAESTEKSPLGTDGKCLVVELVGQQKNVEAVLESKFKKLKGKKEKGYEAFKAQVFPEISSNTIDIYYKVDTKKENESKVVLFLATGYDNWLNPTDHSSELNNAKKMLEGLAAEVRTYELNLAIEAQTKVLEGAVKTQADLEKDLVKLGSDLEKLQKEIEENKKNQELNKKTQEEQKKAIETEKKTLDELQKQLGQVGK